MIWDIIKNVNKKTLKLVNGKDGDSHWYIHNEVAGPSTYDLYGSAVQKLLSWNFPFFLLLDNKYKCGKPSTCCFDSAPFIRPIHQGQTTTGLLREETEHWRNYKWHSKDIGTEKYYRGNSGINTKIRKWLLQTMGKSVHESTKKIRRLW